MLRTSIAKSPTVSVIIDVGCIFILFFVFPYVDYDGVRSGVGKMRLLLLLLNQMWWMLQIVLKDVELYTSEYES